MISPDTAHTVLGVLGDVVALVRYLSPSDVLYDMEEWVGGAYSAVQPHNMAIIIISATSMATQLVYIALFLAFSVGSVRRCLLLLLVVVAAFIGVLASSPSPIPTNSAL
uniref:Uncharacterized protein n=1 Tax=Oryza meridionalis TaxID=40149 RepID=A0A0E0E5X1_9ORYZ